MQTPPYIFCCGGIIFIVLPKSSVIDQIYSGQQVFYLYHDKCCNSTEWQYYHRAAVYYRGENFHKIGPRRL